MLAAGLLAAGCGAVQDPPPPIESCAPDQFLQCDGTVAQICNADGDRAIDLECGPPGCNEEAGRCNECVPDTVTCGPHTVNHCDADGLPAGFELCRSGCIGAPEPHCAYLEPSYAALADVCDAVAVLPALDIAVDQTLDTSSPLVCTGGVIAQPSGPSICVLRAGTITVREGRTLTFSGPHAVALVADAAIGVHGTIDVSANGSSSGPGAARLSGGIATALAGRGGAGFRTTGGDGGSDAADGGAGNGGAASSNPADLVALVGGAHPLFGSPALPGGGGGALALVACRGTITVSSTGLIDAGGGGGAGGFDTLPGIPTDFTSGAGGGAGGNIVLQGLGITVTGQLYANGGAGGGGTSFRDPAVAQDGEDGRRSTTPARGGAGAGLGGAGGSGGTGSALPQHGRMPADPAGTPGGGGASAGFLQTYTPAGVTPILTPAMASPSFQPNRTLRIR